MQVDTNVSEADVGRVQVGQPAQFTVDAYPGQVFRGTVTSIRKAPINVQNVVTYDVVIGVANPDLKLFPGHDGQREDPDRPAQRRAQDPERRAALSSGDGTPRKTQRTAAAAGPARRQAAADQQTVWVMDPRESRRAVQVTLGLTDGTYTEVSGGDLKAGRPGHRRVLRQERGSPRGWRFAVRRRSGGAGGGRRGGF